MTQLRNILFKNWIPKLACLGIAVGLWFWVSMQQTGEARFEVPIEFVNAPPNLVVADRNPRNVRISLEGPKKTLFGTDSSNIHARVDLSGYQAGTKVFWSSEISLETPENLRVESITPRKIELTLARRSEKTLEAEPTISSEPPEGLEYSVSVVPETGTVFGPHESVEALEQLSLGDVDLSGRTPDTYSFAKKARFPQDVNLSYPRENSFRVEVHIYEKRIEKTIEEVPVQVTDVPAGTRALVEPSTIDLRVKGPQRQVEGLTAEDIEVTVKAPEKDTGQSIRVAGSAEINLPDGVSRVQSDGDITALRVQLESL